jgi:hypothetical protein
LIETFDPEGVQLYNLADDLSETKDLAAEKPALVRDLRAELEAWRKEVRAEMMRRNPEAQRQGIIEDDISRPPARGAKAQCGEAPAVEGTAAEAPRASVAALIARAGNTEDEKERWQAVESLASHPKLTPEMKREMTGLRYVADWWANGREKWLKGERWGASPPVRRRMAI